MTKYHRELKCNLAKQYLAGASSYQLSKQYTIPSRQIRYWAQVFDIHGEASFLPTQHSATAQSKLDAIHLMCSNDWSISHTSAQLNLSSSGILSVWLKRYQEHGRQGLEARSRGRSAMKLNINTNKPDDEKSLAELKEELAYLRAENAVLKKLEELAQQKRRQTKKKRPSR